MHLRDPHRRVAAKAILILFFTASWTVTQAETLPDLMWGRSVVKVRAESSRGRASMGSGVVVAQNRVATNCHVTRSASSIVVFKGISGYPVFAQSALLEQDVCILHTMNLNVPPARLGNINQVSPGDEIFVFGFPMAVGLGMVRGLIREMHALDDDYILETDAGFMRGTSGGALFSARGDLIALPTFMLKDESGGHFYAVPVEWVRKALSRNAAPISELDGLTFWENGHFIKRNTNKDPE
ncbi:MAG: S1 family peptidase [Methylococcales bacterium]